MGVGGTIRELGTVLEGLDDEVGSVTSVELLDRLEPDAGVTAEVEVTVPPSTGREREPLFAESADIGADGRIRFVVESADPVVPKIDSAFEIEPTDATIHPDGAVAVTLRVFTRECAVAEGDGDGKPRSEPQTSSPNGTPTGDRDRDVPPFRDPELLAAVYDSCGTFAEMSEQLELDVTAETVRRYMIDYGIHEPNSYETGGESDEAAGRAETDDDPEMPERIDDRSEISTESGEHRDRSRPVVLTDGIGLPDDVTVETLVGAVSESSTIYEVKREIGLEREETFELLRQLGLVDLVVGRVSTERDRRIDREEIVDRLREASAARS